MTQLQLDAQNVLLESAMFGAQVDSVLNDPLLEFSIFGKKQIDYRGVLKQIYDIVLGHLKEENHTPNEEDVKKAASVIIGSGNRSSNYRSYTLLLDVSKGLIYFAQHYVVGYGTTEEQTHRLVIWNRMINAYRYMAERFRQKPIYEEDNAKVITNAVQYNITKIPEDQLSFKNIQQIDTLSSK